MITFALKFLNAFSTNKSKHNRVLMVDSIQKEVTEIEQSLIKNTSNPNLKPCKSTYIKKENKHLLNDREKYLINRYDYYYKASD